MSIKITDLPDAISVSGGDLLPVVQNGVTRKAAVSQITAPLSVSVGLTVPGGFNVSGSPVTDTGTLAITSALNGVVTADGAGNFNAESVLSTSKGGTGLSAIGTAGQVVRVNTDGTALEYASPTSSFVGPLQIGANSASAALTITQTGAGNALVVEDSASTDQTPFVIDASGFLISGYTSSIDGADYQTHRGNSISSYRWTNASGGPYCSFKKSRGAAAGNYAVVASGDTLGSYRWYGDDGASFIEAASVSAAVDGTPGTNDMPGRLVFSTTADGASTPTERMRIDSAGNVGIGTPSAVGRRLSIGGNHTGATGIYAALIGGTVQPDVTTNAYYISSSTNTSANGGTPWTLTNLTHFIAGQGTFHADSTVTNQYGFNAASTLTGAVNNYGFYGSIASGTDRTITFVARTTNVATVTTSVVHGFKTGQRVYVSATTNTGFNAYVTITATPTTDTFTYANTGADVATVADTGTAYNYANFNLFMNGTAPNYFGGKTWVNVSSNEPALRVTQTSTGNAFVVEDSTSPDSTPFAIDGTGKVFIGSGASRSTAFGSALLQISDTISAGASISSIKYANDASAPSISLGKSRSTTPGSYVIAQSGDAVGTVGFEADDGTAIVRGASIGCAVDSTPGAGSMPGRMYLSTTPSGSVVPTVAVWIDSKQSVSIGSNAPAAGRSLQVGKNLTGATSTYGVQMNGTIQPDSTVSSYGFSASIATAANAGVGYTISSVSGFNVAQGTFHADSTVSSQYGFSVAASLVGAANNFGFYGNITAAVGRWNFYAAGTAPNYFAGDLRSGTVVTQATSPTNSDVTATATASSLLAGIRTGTPAAAIDLQVPTGTNMDAAFTSLQNNQSFEWSCINLAGATYAITVTANTDHTVVGNMSVAANTSGRFLTRKTATNTFITYRIS